VRWLRDLVREGRLGNVLGVSLRGTRPDDVWEGLLDAPYEFHADVANGATILTIPACEAAWNSGSDSHLMILHGGVALVCQENPRHG